MPYTYRPSRDRFRISQDKPTAASARTTPDGMWSQSAPPTSPNDEGSPPTDCPLLRTLPRPSRNVSMPRVAANGLTRSGPIRSPLTSPISAPTASPATTPTAMPPCSIIIRDATTLLKPMFAPTEMSKPPIRSANIWASATTTRTEPCRAMFSVLPPVENVPGCHSENTSHTAARPASTCRFVALSSAVRPRPRALARPRSGKLSARSGTFGCLRLGIGHCRHLARERLANVLEVDAHGVLGVRCLALADRPDDLGVVDDRLGPHRRARVRQLAARPGQAPQDRDVSLRRSCGRERGDSRLEQEPCFGQALERAFLERQRELERLDERVDVERGDEDADSVSDLEHVHGGETPQRLAHHVPAHLKALGEHALGRELLTRRQLVGRDHPHDLVPDELGKTAPSADGSVRCSSYHRMTL